MKYKGMTDVLSRTYRNEGMRGLYRVRAPASSHLHADTVHALPGSCWPCTASVPSDVSASWVPAQNLHACLFLPVKPLAGRISPAVSAVLAGVSSHLDACSVANTMLKVNLHNPKACTICWPSDELGMLLVLAGPAPQHAQACTVGGNQLVRLRGGQAPAGTQSADLRPSIPGGSLEGRQQTHASPRPSAAKRQLGLARCET